MSSSPLPPPHLSGAERDALAAIAAHERAADPDFARRLAAVTPDPGPVGAAPPGAGRLAHPRTLVLVAALVALVGLALLPGPWLLAVAVVAVLVVIPTALVTWALRQGRVDPDSDRHPD